MAAGKQTAAAAAAAAAAVEDASSDEVPPAGDDAVELAAASTATDPAVHQLIGHRYTLTQHDDAARKAITRLEAEIAARAVEHDGITAELAKLGYR